MAEVDLTLLRAAFGADAGYLPDGLVVDSSTADWPDVVRVVDAAGWTPVWTSDHREVLPIDIDHRGRLHDSFAIRPGTSIQINFFPNFEVLFDVDLRELREQASVDMLCDVIRRVGRALRKDVLVSQEGSWELVVLRYDAAADSFSLEK